MPLHSGSPVPFSIFKPKCLFVLDPPFNVFKLTCLFVLYPPFNVFKLTCLFYIHPSTSSSQRGSLLGVSLTLHTICFEWTNKCGKLNETSRLTYDSMGDPLCWVCWSQDIILTGKATRITSKWLAIWNT